MSKFLYKVKKNSRPYKLLQIANLDENYNSLYMDTNEIFNIEPKLKFKNGNDLTRSDSTLAKFYKILTIPNNYPNKDINLLWNYTDEEKEFYENEINNKLENEELKITGDTTIKYLKFCGKNEEINDYTRQIRDDIMKFYKDKPCVSCGTTSNLQCDHKNGAYNDTRVMNIETQELNDFQSLCCHCNIVKRQSIKYMKQQNKRQSAKLIPKLEIFDIDFTSGYETFDLNDPDCLIGTYWYDPIDFMKKIKEKLFNNNN